MQVPTKVWWQSKTLLANAALFAAFVIGLVIENATALNVPEQWIIWLGIAAAAVNFGLRLVTDQPVAAHRGETKEVKASGIETHHDSRPANLRDQ